MNRRSFLRAIGIGAGALAVATLPFPAPEPRNDFHSLTFKGLPLFYTEHCPKNRIIFPSEASIRTMSNVSS